MAARFSGEDGHLNTGKSDFLLHNTSNELVLNRSHVEGVNLDTQSVDRSILALFEDATAASESKSMMEEESETLLSALTEMLDRVEEDEDQAFSPFDVLPDSEFLRRAAHRDDSKLSSTQRLQSKPKPLDKALIIKTNRENCQECKLEDNSLQNKFLFCKKKDKKSEAKVDVFSSTSIVSLVNLMHPYCLKLHVEKEDESRRNRSLFSQEEVWRYERPTEQESGEEINVVSDEEAPAEEARWEDRLRGGEGRCLKSALLNGNRSRAPSTRERKRVSFGPVHVASFDESGENRTVGHEAGTLRDADAGQQRGKKARALSLQEYRQLRQNKRPLVEKQGDYTTKWPSVPETPKELTPIFCFQGQKQNPCRPKSTPLHPESSPHRASSLRAPNPAKSKSHRSSLKCPRSEPRTISPASPLPDNTPDPNAVLLERKRSPVKKQTLFNVDPPNPVLLPLPPASAASSSSQSMCSQGIQNIPSAAPSQAITSSSKSPVSHADREFNVNNTTPSQERRSSSTNLPPAQISSAPASQQSLMSGPSQTKCPAPVLSPSPPPLTDVSQSPPEEPSPPPLTDVSQSPPEEPSPPPPDVSQSPPEEPSPPPPDVSQSPPEERSPPPPDVSQSPPEEPSPPPPDVSQSPPEEPSPPQTDRRQPNAAVQSGIEASDLTSLLEQFEETQALKDPVCETEPKLVSASSSSNPQTDPNRPEPAGSERTSRLQLKPLEEPLEPWRTSVSLLDLQTSEPADVPEPLGTEVVLSSERELLSRRQRPASKSVQIIDPRPLPAKKTQTGPAESSPAHMFSYLPLDHDYCGSVDSPPFQYNNTKPPPLREMSKPPTEPHEETRDSKPAEESKKHNSDQTTSHQRHPEQLWTRSEALPFSETSIMQDFSPNRTQSPTSILPTPPPSPPVRGRDKRRYRGRSPRSDSSSRSSSSSSSCSSCSPKRLRIRRRRSGSSSSSSSCASRSPPQCYGLSYPRFSRSRSRSWSRSRSPSLSRSPSPQMRRRPWREVRSSRESRRLRREQETRSQRLKAIDERRVVYVGRIRRSMTQEELSERFSQFGEVECVSLHFRERGDHYGFVTFYNMEDAFAAIDNGGKLRQPDELPFDICFGGRRQFCNTDYADLDANRDAERTSPKSRFEDLDFDSLLKQAQRGLKR